jgi:outer membrane protein OmpA-like peptidoglycan-associated protein
MEAPVNKMFTITEGATFQLKNIYYNFNDATIRPDAVKDLEALLLVMTKYSDMEIELSSHTDSRGSDSFNVDLSQRRAANAYEWLVKRGIEPHRIIAKGYGESRLRNDCTDGSNCTETEHSKNRRTEIKITKSGSAEGHVMTELMSNE